MSLTTKHFVFFIPMAMAFYGLLYGAGVGALAGIINLFLIPSEESILIILFCSLFTAILGAIAGMMAGSWLGFIDSIFIALTIRRFWQKEILWHKRSLFRATILLMSLIVNMLGGAIMLEHLGSPQLLINTILTGVGTIFFILHFEHWHFNYLIKYPEILYTTELDFYYISSLDEFTDYEMPAIPYDLTYYTDGELPEEILSQFPTYK